MHDIRKNEEEKFVNGLEKKKNPIHKDKDPPHVIEFYFIFKIKIKLTQAKKKKEKNTMPDANNIFIFQPY
ncbi:hypothetical protein [Dickeya oryzae]